MLDQYHQSIITQAAIEAVEANRENDRYLNGEASRPFMLLRPRIFQDGNKWCALYGDNIQEGVCAFGDSPDEASRRFDCEWQNGQPITANKE